MSVKGKAAQMSNFIQIENAELAQVSGGWAWLVPLAGAAITAAATSGSTDRVYGNNLEECKQQANNNFGGFIQGLRDRVLGRGDMLTDQLNRCEDNYGKKASAPAAPGT